MIDKVKTILADTFDLEVTDIPDNASPELLEDWDSIRHMMLLNALEQQLELKFSVEEMEETMSLEGILDVLKRKGDV